MDVIFYLIPCLIMAVALFMGYRVVRRRLQMRRAWNSGLTAQGRCLRMFTTTHGGGESSVRTTIHHVYEFQAKDGRPIRFEEEDGPATRLEGDLVTVYYYADGPDVVAIAQEPGRLKHTATTVATLAFVGVVVVFCVGFMATFHTMNSGSDDSGYSTTMP